ncbi:MAG: hypothetical protein CSA05_01540 [Bacteroidia bacterium]|nr:MAG: hypothetical protein CSB01_01350 [Bacteroidia bacterium]PIE86223.1 MAG: hypothetical protein CSA05_01540 [Bacteroidia bacterium]
MESIEIKGYKEDYFIPSVSFDADTGHCLIEGESYLEETVEFYAPLLKWLEEYTSAAKGPITFDFKLTYFNTSSSKRILDIMLMLKEYEESGGAVTANWYIEDDDSDMEDEVEDFRIASDLNLNIINVAED